LRAKKLRWGRDFYTSVLAASMLTSAKLEQTCRLLLTMGGWAPAAFYPTDLFVGPVEHRGG